MDAELNLKSLNVLRRKAREQYDTFTNPAWCESLETEVFFNSKGFHHILYNGLGHKRSPAEQIRRLTLLPHIIPILKAKLPVTHRYVVSQDTHYWGIDASIGKKLEKNIRLVLRKVGTGNITFWSVMELDPNKKNSR